MLMSFDDMFNNIPKDIDDKTLISMLVGYLVQNMFIPFLSDDQRKHFEGCKECKDKLYDTCKKTVTDLVSASRIVETHCST